MTQNTCFQDLENSPQNKIIDNKHDKTKEKKTYIIDKVEYIDSCLELS